MMIQTGRLLLIGILWLGLLWLGATFAPRTPNHHFPHSPAPRVNPANITGQSTARRFKPSGYRPHYRFGRPWTALPRNSPSRQQQNRFSPRSGPKVLTGGY